MRERGIRKILTFVIPQIARKIFGKIILKPFYFRMGSSSPRITGQAQILKPRGFLGIMWSNNLYSEKYANSTCSHEQHILFFFSLSRSFNVLELNTRRKSEILDQFETDQSQPFCLSGMYKSCK